MRRPVICLLVLVGSLALAPAAGAQSLPRDFRVTLEGSAPRASTGPLVATAKGARAVLRLRTSRRRDGRCAGSVGAGTLTARGGTLRLQLVRERCSAATDRETGTAVVLSSTGRLRGTKAVLQYLIVRRARGGRSHHTVTVRRLPSQYTTDVKCELCRFITKMIRARVEARDTRYTDERNDEGARIELDGVCEALPSSYANQCRSLVDEYLAYLLYYVREGSHSETAICQFVQHCVRRRSVARGSAGACGAAT